MLIKNKTDQVQKAGETIVLPWRDAVIEDTVEIDTEVFEIVSGEQVKKSNLDSDLNKDGKFDKADKTIAAKIMRKKY